MEGLIREIDDLMGNFLESLRKIDEGKKGVKKTACRLCRDLEKDFKEFRIVSLMNERGMT